MTGIAPAATSCCRLSSDQHCESERPARDYRRRLPEWVMLSKAPVALRCTRMSVERAIRVKGTRAPDFAILVLFSSADKYN